MQNPSKYQQAIFDFVADPEGGSAVVEAVAGSGKTTTIVEAANRLPVGRPALFLAFNKSIAEELGQRLPATVNARTFHSAGMAAWRGHYRGTVKVDTDKLAKLVAGYMESAAEPQSEEWWRLAKAQSAAKRLVGLAQSVGLVPAGAEERAPNGLVPDTDESWKALVEHHDVQCEDVAASVSMAREVLRRAIMDAVEGGTVNFDDMVYLPVVCGAPFKRYAWLFVDEAQDVSDLQRAMLRAMLAKDGRLVAVGDPAQAIYGWRGAASDALEQVKADFGCRTLPLSISYRCPRLVVEEAQKYAPQIEASPTAPEGKVERLASWGPATLQPRDAVLCRNVAPLMELCLRLIRSGQPCWVRGRDIGKGLVALVRQMKAGDSVERLRAKLHEHMDAEVSRYLKAGKEDRADAVEDRVLSVLAVADHAGVKTVAALVKRVEDLFKDRGRGAELCTVHKAKGLEWDRVFVLDRATRMPSRWARRDWQRQQEVNLIYVAVTRAKRELYDVDSATFRD